MHEAKFTEDIVQAIIKELETHSQANPKKVRVRVGEMFHLNKDSVLLHYALLTKKTELEGIAIELEEEPVTIECNKCHGVGSVEDHHLLMCQRCDSRDVKVLSGDQIFVEFEAKNKT